MNLLKISSRNILVTAVGPEAFVDRYCKQIERLRYLNKYKTFTIDVIQEGGLVIPHPFFHKKLNSQKLKTYQQVQKS
ncbi:MAG: hypothetical protein WAM14_13680 [Candidatus Nitrosopolaris sp.]